MDIDIQDLLDYLDGNLEDARKAELEKYFNENPSYFQMLRGLKVARESFSSDSKVIEHLNQVRANILDKGMDKDRIRTIFGTKPTS